MISESSGWVGSVGNGKHTTCASARTRRSFPCEGGLTIRVSLCILRRFSQPAASHAATRAQRQRVGPSMYAVIRTGGKQYKVSAGEKLKIESIAAQVGSQIVLDQVLLVADGEKITTGTPLVSGAAVQATVLAHGRGEKIQIFKMRRRKH